MHNDSQDESARVRHVPIHIESRQGRDNQRQHANQRQQGHDQYNGHQFDHHPSFYSDYSSQTLPNTSSININYKPPPPARPSSQQSQRNPSANDQRNSSYTQDQHPDQIRSNSAGSSRFQGNHDPGNLSANNSDKLVNSPEPIPLPPPPPSENLPKVSTNQGQNNDAQSQPTQPEQDKAKNANPEQTGEANILCAINSIKSDLTNLLQEITKFSGLSAKSKEYRYLDEMLTRCMLNLDNIEVGDSTDLRQHRRTAIKFVDQATDILQRKLQINTDIQNLSENMATIQ